jgi:hypothetical protein
MGDPAQVVTGPPNHWSDAGVNDEDEPLIYLWPIPEGNYTIRFRGYKALSDLGTDNKEDSVDPFFGKISEWGACMSAGIRYYHELDDNESAESIVSSKALFDKAIDVRRKVNRASVNAGTRMRNVRTGGRNRPRPGRFNPAHFDNRSR